MKIIRITLVFLPLFILSCSYAQGPKKVHSYVKVKKKPAFYSSQMQYWEQVLANDPQNADAWLNYFTSHRMTYLLGKSDSGFKSSDYKEELEKMIDQMETHIPNTFEYNYIKWRSGGNSTELYPYLMKAYEIGPDRPELYSSLIVYYELQRDTVKVGSFCKQWYNSNDYSPAILNFGYNVLMSLDENAIIITNGDNDTYPLWIMQYAKNIRKDVKVINTSLLLNKDYCDLILKECGINEPDKKTVEINNPAERQLKLIEHIVNSSGAKPVYFAVTVSNNIFRSYKDNLYLEGLAFKYSTNRYDNIAILKRNFEKRFLNDYLLFNFVNDISAEVVKEMNTNYLLPLLTLYDFYKKSEDTEGMKSMEQLLLKISKKGGKYDDIKAHIGK